MKYTFKWYVLRWLAGFAMLADGVVIIVSFGFAWTSFELFASNLFLTEFEKSNSLGSKNV